MGVSLEIHLSIRCREYYNLEGFLFQCCNRKLRVAIKRELGVRMDLYEAIAAYTTPLICSNPDLASTTPNRKTSFLR